MGRGENQNHFLDYPDSPNSTEIPIAHLQILPEELRQEFEEQSRSISPQKLGERNNDEMVREVFKDAVQDNPGTVKKVTCVGSSPAPSVHRLGNLKSFFENKITLAETERQSRVRTPATPHGKSSLKASLKASTSIPDSN